MPPRFGVSSALAGRASDSAAKSATAAASDGRYEIATPRLPCRSAPCSRRDRNLSDVTSISRPPGARTKAEYAARAAPLVAPDLCFRGGPPPFTAETQSAWRGGVRPIADRRRQIGRCRFMPPSGPCRRYRVRARLGLLPIGHATYHQK